MQTTTADLPNSLRPWRPRGYSCAEFVCALEGSIGALAMTQRSAAFFGRRNENADLIARRERSRSKALAKALALTVARDAREAA